MNIIKQKLDFINSPFVRDLNIWCTLNGGVPKVASNNRFIWSSDFWTIIIRQHDNAMCLDYIEITEDTRLHGLGTKLMKIICDIADKNRTNILLEVSQFDINEVRANGGDEHWLEKWYIKMGFESIQVEGIYGPWMERAAR